MSMRYKGGIISATAPTTTTSTASGVWSSENVFQAIGAVTWPRSPAAPTIGTATDLTTGGSVSVPFTAPSDTGSTAITSYASLSTPGSLSSTNSASPITATGLTNGTAYTFQVRATNSAGTGPYSGASNSVSPTLAPNYIEEVFQTWLYTGNGSTQTITNGIDLSTKGGLVWIKGRNIATNNLLFDTNRGVNNYLVSDGTNAQANPGSSLSAFNTTGFQVTNLSNFINESPYNYVSWTFREQAKFFDIVTYTGDGSVPRSIPHALGSVPGFVAIKLTSGTDNWICRHRSLGDTPNDMTNYTPNSRIFLNLTNAAGSSSNIKADATNLTVNHVGDLNASGQTYVAYLFAHDAGGFGLTGSDNVISCGSYAGSNNPSYPTPGAGRTVTLGYEPQWVMIKNVTTAGMNWVIMDNMRLFDLSGYGWIFPNSSGAEQSGSGSDVYVSPTATGFRTYGNNATVDGGSTSETFIYIAIRRGPMKIPTVGTTVFSPAYGAYTLGTKVTTNFPVDLQFGSVTGGSSLNALTSDRLRGVSANATASSRFLITSSTAAESTLYSTTQFWDNTGFQTPTAFDAPPSVFWNMRRAPSFFDVVCYTGTASNPGVLTHNLGVVPELMIVKCRSDVNYWAIYTAFTGNTKSMLLPDSGAAAVRSTWNNTSPTSTTFTVENDTRVFYSGFTYVAYLFATCAGVSKVGNYTGTAALLTVNCSFTTGARFVLIKRTDSTGDWYVWDSARGITSGNDPYLLINSTAAEVTGTNYVDTDTTGFKVTAAAPAALNASGGTYIFLAIA